MDTPRLIASDVDGTLIDPHHRLTERTLAALRRARAAGVELVLVTGRPPRWIPPVAVPAELTGYAVCANGALVYHIGDGELVSAHTLDPLLLHDVAHALEKVLPGMQVATERPVLGDETAGALASEHGYHNPWGDEESRFLPRAEVLGEPATKLLVRHRGMTSAEMALAARELVGESVDVTYSTNSGLIEISAAGVTKASGLAEVTTLLGVDAAGVVAFGDMNNDVEMLRWAGLGVAMGNASAEVKGCADEVTATNGEDGVALVLERWF
ncbi:Cof-type HAD-IIB family hydrolase [Actinokineospora bangkokensis]|uniref:HAD family hydrolase n=1 Tax=Actinokineospora bangkokensis TaxID=1193682 RepID=A0A1Q9LHA3_9PSEU|nr:Cof-type HAD-IIB family hydrolase [Actinokineospora bangkokensis]OLR91395.1 HAD family hydrolase [Actinokineospora bangkokensis]